MHKKARYLFLISFCNDGNSALPETTSFAKHFRGWKIQFDAVSLQSKLRKI